MTADTARPQDLTGDLRTLRRSLPAIVGPATAELWQAFGRIEAALGHGIYAGVSLAPAPAAPVARGCICDPREVSVGGQHRQECPRASQPVPTSDTRQTPALREAAAQFIRVLDAEDAAIDDPTTPSDLELMDPDVLSALNDLRDALAKQAVTPGPAPHKHDTTLGREFCPRCTVPALPSDVILAYGGWLTAGACGSPEDEVVAARHLRNVIAAHLPDLTALNSPDAPVADPGAPHKPYCTGAEPAGYDCPCHNIPGYLRRWWAADGAGEGDTTRDR